MRFSIAVPRASRAGIQLDREPVSQDEAARMELIDQALVCVHSRIVLKSQDLRFRRRQTGQVKRQPSNLCPATRLGHRSQLTPLQMCNHKLIDWIADPGSVFHLRRGYPSDGAKCPMITVAFAELRLLICRGLIRESNPRPKDPNQERLRA